MGYLGRCQWLLQQGQPVEDFAIYAGDRPYQHWGLYLDKPYESATSRLPRGYSYDIINDDALLNRVTLKGGKLVLPSGISYGALVWDPEFRDEPLKPAVLAKVDEFRKGGLKVFNAASAGKVATLAPPDFDGPFRAVHRRDASTDTDIYFVVGSGSGEMTFRVSGRPAEIWDAVTGDRWAAKSTPTDDGRTKVSLDLPKDGSAFVVFRPGSVAQERDPPAATPPTGGTRSRASAISGPWQVSFAYHPGIAATPPASRTLATFRRHGHLPHNGDAHRGRGARRDAPLARRTALWPRHRGGEQHRLRHRVVRALGSEGDIPPRQEHRGGARHEQLVQPPPRRLLPAREGSRNEKHAPLLERTEEERPEASVGHPADGVFRLLDLRPTAALRPNRARDHSITYWDNGRLAR